MSVLVRTGKPPALAADGVLGVIPEHAGPRLTTPKGDVMLCMRPAESFTFRSPGDLVVVLLAPVRGFESRSPLGTARVLDAPAGALAIVPANVERSGGWASPLETLTVGFEPGQLAALAEQEFGLADLHLSLPGFGTIDEHALQLARLLRQELQQGSPNTLYADSLITVLGLHVIRNYSDAEKPKFAKPAGGLSAIAAKRVQEFIGVNLAGKMTIAELAALCGLSPSHFMAAFARTFGVPPYQYVLNLRLALAVQLLAQTALPIVEVAHLSGFSSQSHLTAAMRKQRGITPAKIRAESKA